MSITEDPVDLICRECGIAFAVPVTWYRARRHTGAPFWCPNGDPLVFRKSADRSTRRAFKAEKVA